MNGDPDLLRHLKSDQGGRNNLCVLFEIFFVLTALFLLITAGLFLFGDKLVLSQTVGLFNLRAGWERTGIWYFYTIVDEDNKEIDRMGRYVYLDDEIITEDNRHYKIVKTDSKKGVATGKLMVKPN